jgi:pre-mRNA-splicing factor CWC26
MAGRADYLKRYLGGGGGDAGGAAGGDKKRRRKKAPGAAAGAAAGVRIVDEDVNDWRTRPPGERRGGYGDEDEDGEDGGGGEDAPVLEVAPAHLARLQRGGAGAAGGAWVTLSPRGEGGGGDLSPPRRVRHDSPVRARGALPLRACVGRNPAFGHSLPHSAAALTAHALCACVLCVVCARAQDASPVRRGRHDSSPDVSPPRRPVAATAAAPAADLSPPRRRAAAAVADLSPPRRRRHDSSPDISPPRRGGGGGGVGGRAAPAPAADLSPPRRGRHDSSPDVSPPRRPAAAGPADLSPPRRGVRHDSPPADLSPPRRRAAGADADADLSPPRRPSAADAAAAPPPPPPGGAPSGRTRGADAIMTDGSRAGLVSGADVVAEARAKRDRDATRLAALGDDDAGRGAGTVYRDKSGRVVDQAAAARERQEAAAKARPPPERPAWGAGLAQQRGAEAAAREMAATAAAPFARFADDAALDAVTRRRSRWGDPLAGLTGGTGAVEEPAAPAVPGGDAEWLARAGYKIPTEVPPHSWLRRRVGAPPNRYGIAPGRHWDGVDRSTGTEVQFVKLKADAATKERDAWLYVQSAYE